MVDLENLRNFVIPYPAGRRTIFGVGWEYEELPETHREQILVLDQVATKYLFSFTNPFMNVVTGDLWDPFLKGNFKSVEKFYEIYNNDESKKKLKKWIYGRGIPFKSWVFILTNHDDHAILTTWKMIVKYSYDLFLMDDVMIFDHTLDWCLFFFHENELFFGKGKYYDPREHEAMMHKLNERKKLFPQFKHPYL